MKKIFTLIFALILAASCAYAQSLTLSYEGTAVNNGDTVEVVVPVLNEPTKCYLDIANDSEEDITVRVYKNELEMVEGAIASLCFAGACYDPTVSVSVRTVVIPALGTLPHSAPEGFHMEYQTPMAGTSFIQFVFENVNDSEDQAVIVFKLVYDPTSVMSMAVATKMRAYPNPASENVTIEYAYNGNSKAVKLVIKNLVGTTLYSKKLDVNNNKTKVDLSEYSSGIYFYSIEADGKPLITKKLLVK
jgi:hypothetical protein